MELNTQLLLDELISIQKIEMPRIKDFPIGNISEWKTAVLDRTKLVILKLHDFVEKVGEFFNGISPDLATEISDFFFRLIRDHTYLDTSFYCFDVAVSNRISNGNMNYALGASILYPRYFTSPCRS